MALHALITSQYPRDYFGLVSFGRIAHIRGDDIPDFHYPPSAETVEETLKEVVRCTRAGIRINTFMLDETHSLRAFVERMTAAEPGPGVLHDPETVLLNSANRTNPAGAGSFPLRHGDPAVKVTAM